MSHSDVEKKIKVVLVDDQILYRECLRNLFNLWPEFTVIEEASNGNEAIEICLNESPDLVLMDIQMPGMNGIEAAREISVNNPNATIVMLTVSTEAGDVIEVAQSNIQGYLLKDTPARQLRLRLHNALKGEAVYSDAITGALVAEVNRVQHRKMHMPEEAEAMKERITARELDVLYRIADGKSNEEIARDLYLSVGTVKKLVASLMEKLDANNRVQVAARAFQIGLLE